MSTAEFPVNTSIIILILERNLLTAGSTLMVEEA